MLFPVAVNISLECLQLLVAHVFGDRKIGFHDFILAWVNEWFAFAFEKGNDVAALRFVYFRNVCDGRADDFLVGFVAGETVAGAFEKFLAEPDGRFCPGFVVDGFWHLFFLLCTVDTKQGNKQ